MDDPIRKHDGQVLLFRRNGIYQARIHLGKGKYLPRSLKTANELCGEMGDDEVRRRRIVAVVETARTSRRSDTP